MSASQQTSAKPYCKNMVSFFHWSGLASTDINHLIFVRESNTMAILLVPYKIYLNKYETFCIKNRHL